MCCCLPLSSHSHIVGNEQIQDNEELLTDLMSEVNGMNGVYQTFASAGKDAQGSEVDSVQGSEVVDAHRSELEAGNGSELEAGQESEVDESHGSEVEAGNGSEVEDSHWSEVEDSHWSEVEDSYWSEVEDSYWSEVEDSHWSEVEAGHGCDVKGGAAPVPKATNADRYVNFSDCVLKSVLLAVSRASQHGSAVYIRMVVVGCIL